MPGGVPRTSTFALNNATLPFVLALADKGWKQALADDPHLAERPQHRVRQGHLRAGRRGAGLRLRKPERCWPDLRPAEAAQADGDRRRRCRRAARPSRDAAGGRAKTTRVRRHDSAEHCYCRSGAVFGTYTLANVIALYTQRNHANACTAGLPNARIEPWLHRRRRLRVRPVAGRRAPTSPAPARRSRTRSTPSGPKPTRRRPASA